MKKLWFHIRKLHAGFVRVVSYGQSPLLLIVRLYWGVQFAQNGWGKLHNLPRVTDYFSSLGLPNPGPTAAFVSSVELIGGILLAAGLFTRITGLALTIDMVVAYIVADRDAWLSFFSNPDKFTGGAEFTFLFASLLALIFGPGKISLDSLFEWLARKHSS